MLRSIAATAFSSLVIWAAIMTAGIEAPVTGRYDVLDPITEGALTIFPVTGQPTLGADRLLTLDEGLRSGDVVVTEQGSLTGLRRRRPGVMRLPTWPEMPSPEQPYAGAEVNSLALVNNSTRPLVLLAGEIVSGGKQDRVVSKDRIVRPQSEIALGVFCVEPHRWTESTHAFKAFPSAMVQPSVRQKAMAEKNQEAVWDQVQKARSGIGGRVPAARTAIDASSSYAQAVEASPVRREMDATAVPIEQRFLALSAHLRDRQALGAVVAINGRIVWADVFASPALFNKYWPKLVRSYAAEAMSNPPARNDVNRPDPRAFLHNLKAGRETAETEPGLFRNTQLTGNDFEAFILTALLPGNVYDVHVTKMARF